MLECWVSQGLNPTYGYRVAIARNNQVAFPLRFNNAYWALVPKKPDDWPLTKELRISGVRLSIAFPGLVQYI